MKTLTGADFARYEPCYVPQERYRNFKGTILDILKDSRISDEDKIWAFTREGIVDDCTLRLFACRCVRQVWHLLTDERSRNIVEVAERYANGEAPSEAAWLAAWYAAAAWVRAEVSAVSAESAARQARAALDAAINNQVQIAIELLEEQ